MAVIGFLAFFCISIGGDENDEQKTFSSFIAYTNEVYRENFEKSADKDIRLRIYEGTFGSLNPLVYGYSLGNLLQYARRGSKNHKIWLMLERKLKEKIFADIEWEGWFLGLDRATIEKRKQKQWTVCMLAQQGWHDANMMLWTRVDTKNAPNFFESMSEYDPEDKKASSKLVPSHFMVEDAFEIGSDFFFSGYGEEINEIRAKAYFESRDKKTEITVGVIRIADPENYERMNKRFQNRTLKVYRGERLNLGESTYIVKTGRAAYASESFPGFPWHFFVEGKYYYLGTEEDDANAPKVKLAVTNAITAMYNRFIELVRR